jgi:hypothetical protein
MPEHQGSQPEPRFERRLSRREGRPAGRHRRAVLEAEVSRLVRELRVLGAVPKRQLVEQAGADHWREGSVEAAIALGVRQRRLRRLPFDFVAPADEGPSDERPSDAQHRR